MNPEMQPLEYLHLRIANINSFEGFPAITQNNISWVLAPMDDFQLLCTLKAYYLVMVLDTRQKCRTSGIPISINGVLGLNSAFDATLLSNACRMWFVKIKS